MWTEEHKDRWGLWSHQVSITEQSSLFFQRNKEAKVRFIPVICSAGVHASMNAPSCTSLHIVQANLYQHSYNLNKLHFLGNQCPSHWNVLFLMVFLFTLSKKQQTKKQPKTPPTHTHTTQDCACVFVVGSHTCMYVNLHVTSLSCFRNTLMLFVPEMLNNMLTWLKLM